MLMCTVEGFFMVKQRYSFPLLSLSNVWDDSDIYEMMVRPDGTFILGLTQDTWRIKWAEIMSFHVSPHNVWTRHRNWKLFPDGTHLYQHPVKGPIIVTIKDGRRLIRNHRAYWKKYLVPNTFSEEQWDMMCWYHDPADRFVFNKGSDKDRLALYYKYRSIPGFAQALGKDHRGEIYRMDTWMWGSGDCSNGLIIRSRGKFNALHPNDKLCLDFVDQEDLIRSSLGECVWPRHTEIHTTILTDKNRVLLRG